ncbi:MAG: hypothetical protein IPP30_05655 [Flavobacterium sp.]|nr:hypothetical protein [Flavobacterium sp.]
MAPSTRNYATQMTLPAGMPGIKMIQGTGMVVSFLFILGTDKNCILRFKLWPIGDQTTTID